MAFKIITLAKTKELLGITNTDLDTEITRYIPIIDAKVKLITKNRYNFKIIGNVESGSKVVEVYGISNATGGINNKFTLDDLEEFLQVGMLIQGAGLADNSYIDDVYYNGYSANLVSVDRSIPAIILNDVATSTDTDAELFIGFNIGLQTTVAKGIAWMIGEENQNTPLAGLLSRSIGSTRLSWSVSQSQIDGRYGMPSWFVKAFPVYMSGH